jgi:hypothetical protein
MQIILCMPTLLTHGSHSVLSRFNVTHHAKAAGCSGYIELLEIHDPPAGKCSIVIHKYHIDKGCVIIEFDTLQNAIIAWRFCYAHVELYHFRDQVGFLRMIEHREKDPWFYAGDADNIEGDWIVPHAATS